MSGIAKPEAVSLAFAGFSASMSGMANLSNIRIYSALIVALLAGCQSMQDLIGAAPKPTAHVIGAGIRGLSLENIVLLFDVEVDNPYATSLPLVDLRYSLASGGKTFLEGTVQPTGSIPPRGSRRFSDPDTGCRRSRATAGSRSSPHSGAKSSGTTSLALPMRHSSNIAALSGSSGPT